MSKFIDFLVTTVAVMLGTVIGLALFFFTVILIEYL